MSSIYLDPVAMRATAGAISENAMRVQETVTGTRSACACDVPRSLIGWLDEELLALTVGAMEAAVGYLQAAVDTVQRAQQIEADQSLVSAQAEVGTPVNVTTMGDLGAVLADAGGTIGGGGTWSDGIDSGASNTTIAWIGGAQGSLGIMDSNVSTDTTTAWVGGAAGSLGGMDSAGLGTTTVWIGPPTVPNPLLEMAMRMQHGNPGLSPGLARSIGLETDQSSSLAASFLAPNGLSVVRGLYEDGAGNRGDIGHVYARRDRPGVYEVSP